MRALFALTAVPVAVGALALTGSPARRHPAHHARLLSASTCSAAAGCAQGCAVPVAAGAPARPPTSPCAKQSQRGCVEYVAGRLTLPGARGEASCAPGGPLAYGERLLSPPTLRGLDRRARRALRSHVPLRRLAPLRKHTR